MQTQRTYIKSIIVMGDFWHLSGINRTSSVKNSKHTDGNNMINEQSNRYVYWTLHQSIKDKFFSSTHETFSNTDLHHVTCQLYLSKAKGRNWSYVCPKSKSQPTFKNWKHTEYVLYAVKLEIRKEKIPWKCPLDPEINKMITSWS